MTIPLIVLSILSVFGGILNLPSFIGGNSNLDKYLQISILSKHEATEILSHSTEYFLIAISLIVILSMILWAKFKFINKSIIPKTDEYQLSLIPNLIYNKYYIDEIYENIFVSPYNYISKNLLIFIEGMMDYTVDASGNVWIWCSRYLRKLQNGNTSFYLFAMVLAIIMIIFFNDYFL